MNSNSPIICPKCSAPNDKGGVEPCIKTEMGKYVVGMHCDACGYKQEYTLKNGLPLPLESAMKVIEAMAILAMEAFRNKADIRIGHVSSEEDAVLSALNTFEQNGGNSGS